MRETKCVVVWNYEQSFCPFFQTWNFQIFLSFTLLSSLSQVVVEIRTTSRFSPQRVVSECLHLIIRYIYTQHIHSSCIFQQQQSLLISRAFIFREYAHTNRRKDGHDDQQQQRGDDDDDDEKKSSSHVLSIWRKIFCFQCEQRVESSSGEQKNEQSKYHNESIRSRRYHHRRRRVVRERSVAIGDSGLNRFLGHVVWAVQVNQQSGGESGAGVSREFEDCENRNGSKPNFSGEVRGVRVADVDGV